MNYWVYAKVGKGSLLFVYFPRFRKGPKTNKSFLTKAMVFEVFFRLDKKTQTFLLCKRRHTKSDLGCLLNRVMGQTSGWAKCLL